MLRKRVEHLTRILAERLRAGRLARSGPIKLTGDGTLDPDLVARIVLTDAEDLLRAAETGQPVADERWHGLQGDLETLCALMEHPGGDGAESADVPIETPLQIRSTDIGPERQDGRPDQRPSSA